MGAPESYAAAPKWKKLGALVQLTLSSSAALKYLFVSRQAG